MPFPPTGAHAITPSAKEEFLEEFKFQSSSAAAGNIFGSVPMPSKHFLKKSCLDFQKGTKIRKPDGSVVDARDAGKSGKNKRVFNNNLALNSRKKNGGFGSSRAGGEGDDVSEGFDKNMIEEAVRRSLEEAAGRNDGRLKAKKLQDSGIKVVISLDDSSEEDDDIEMLDDSWKMTGVMGGGGDNR